MGNPNSQSSISNLQSSILLASHPLNRERSDPLSAGKRRAVIDPDRAGLARGLENAFAHVLDPEIPVQPRVNPDAARRQPVGPWEHVSPQLRMNPRVCGETSK